MPRCNKVIHGNIIGKVFLYDSNEIVFVHVVVFLRKLAVSFLLTHICRVTHICVSK